MSTLQFIQTTPEELAELIIKGVKSQLEDFKKEFSSQNANEDLLTRKEACEFLKIDSSTLWAWTNKGKVFSYGIANRRYYKRSELLESLKLVKR
jgi:hypothetical protein